MGLIDDLLLVANDILGVRDAVGAVIHPVFFVTRTWSGSSPGDGTPTDTKEQMLPSPSIVAISHELSAQPGGTYQQGDLLLQSVSKQSYPSEDVVAGKSTEGNVEKFFEINGKLYQPINVRESYITWEVHVRKLSHA